MNTCIKSTITKAIKAPGSYFGVQGIQEFKLFGQGPTIRVNNPKFVYDNKSNNNKQITFYGTQYSQDGLVTDVSFGLPVPKD